MNIKASVTQATVRAVEPCLDFAVIVDRSEAPEKMKQSAVPTLIFGKPGANALSASME
jgi:hypothetical protein